jgi:GDPmannose 4,6-dehydratase
MISPNKTKTALICGVGGQDGALLAKFLLSKSYDVWGTSRDAGGASFGNLVRLGVAGQVRTLSMDPEEFRSVFMALRRAQPDEVYFLAGQTSVGLSYEQPAETIQSISLGALNILEACRLLDRPVRIFHAGSSECFGNTEGVAANETTPFQPRSPYAVAKAAAIWLVDNYRESYGLFACSGILFNHESALRPTRFVTQKIIHAVKRIAKGDKEPLRLGNLDISRDWGWAPEYVEAMWLILQQPEPENFVVATGETNSLEDFVDIAFQQAGLNWRDHVELSQALVRPSDIRAGFANPAKAREKLNWTATKKMREVIFAMYGAAT